MKSQAKILMCIAVGLLSANCLAEDVEALGFRDLFDGKDLAGWVNGISKASVKKGYICLESEGAEIHFRNIRILELPPGITTPGNTAPIAKDN